RIAHRIQRANLAHVRRQFKPDYQRGAQRDDRFEIRRQKGTDPRQIAHLRRVIAILRDADDLGTRAECEQCLRYRRRQRYDSHPRGRVRHRRERQSIYTERGGGRESIPTHIAKLPDRTGAGKRILALCCLRPTRSTSLVGTGSIAVLKIAVCIKQIPLIEEANFDAATKTIKRDGPNVISAFDLRAISLAVELKNRHGAETTVVTMGPPQARDALVDALAMGMDRAVHLEDRAFAGADTLATARTLALWLARNNFDLIVLGKYSLDAETGQVGPEIAELIGAAQITGARKLDIIGRTIRAERESDEGFDEVEAAMPAVITCAERVAQPVKVKPGASDEAAAKPIEVVRATELGADAKEFGLAGSPTWVQEVRVVTTPKTEPKFIDASDPERAAAEVVSALESIGALKPRVHNRRQIAAARRAGIRGRDLWIVCETDLEGRVTRGTLELLSRGDELASRLGGALVAVGLDGGVARHAGLLASFGADLVLTVEHPALASYTPEAAAEAAAQLVLAHAPWGILIGATER